MSMYLLLHTHPWWDDMYLAISRQASTMAPIQRTAWWWNLLCPKGWRDWETFLLSPLPAGYRADRWSALADELGTGPAVLEIYSYSEIRFLCWNYPTCDSLCFITSFSVPQISPPPFRSLLWIMNSSSSSSLRQLKPSTCVVEREIKTWNFYVDISPRVVQESGFSMLNTVFQKLNFIRHTVPRSDIMTLYKPHRTYDPRNQAFTRGNG